MKSIVIILAAFASTAAPALAIEHHVTIRNMTFDPDVVDAEVGDIVVFTNTDVVSHRAVAIKKGLDNGPAGRAAFDTGLIYAQSSAKITLTRSGVIDFLCTFHPRMRAQIVAR